MSAATAMIADMTMDDFSPYLNQPFAIHVEGEGAPRVAQLIEVTPLPARDGGRAPFSIVLRSSEEPALPQRIYCVEQAEMGRMDIFLVPIGPDGEGMCYEALFA